MNLDPYAELLKRILDANAEPTPELSVEDFRQQVENDIAEAQERIDAYDERASIQSEQSQATTGLALDALQRPDTAWGKHAVAKAWLREYDRNVYVFKRTP